MWKSSAVMLCIIVSMGCSAPKETKTENEWIKLFNGKLKSLYMK